MALSGAGVMLRVLSGSRLGWPVVALPLLLCPAAVASGQLSGGRTSAATAVRVAVAVVAATGATVLAFAVVLLVMGRLPDDRDQRFVLPAAVIAVVSIAAWVPLHRRAQEAVTRLVHGERFPPTDVLATFGDRASRGVPGEELLRQVAESIGRSLRPGSIELWIGEAGHMEVAVAVPYHDRAAIALDAPAARTLAGGGVFGRSWLELWAPGLLAGRLDTELRLAPAAHAGSVLGLVVVERPAGSEPFLPEDDNSLADVGRRLGVVLHNQRLDSALRATLVDLQHSNSEVIASRARLVAAADAERRRLERDLHDGAQQHLLALAVELAAAGDLVATDPAGAMDALAKLRGEVRATIEGLRDLARGIYPPLLMEVGLVPALRAAGRRTASQIHVAADLEARFDPDVEAAVYFSCLEALQNAAKHAPGAAVTLRLSSDTEWLTFEVQDDGPGFVRGAAADGSGLQNIQDRVGAIGGTVEWRSSAAGGTTVVGMIPVGTRA